MGRYGVGRLIVVTCTRLLVEEFLLMYLRYRYPVYCIYSNMLLHTVASSALTTTTAACYRVVTGVAGIEPSTKT
jgi:hypothetical protein